MYKKDLITILFNLGVHIGHLKQETKSTNWNFIMGNIKNVNVINLQLSIFYLKRSLFLLKEYGYVNGNLLFFSTNFYFFNKNLKSYLIHLIVFKEKQSLFSEKWKNGCLSNYKTQVIDFLNVINLFKYKKKNFDFITKKKTSPKGYKIFRFDKSWKVINKDYKLLSWVDFLIQVIFFIKQKKIVGLSWSQEWKRVSKFWRFYYYFKFYNNFFKWPDLCILINNFNRDSIISEINKKKIPILGLLDSNIKGNGFTYYIPSNDDSSLITLFYFRLFINAYNKGKNKYFYKLKK